MKLPVVAYRARLGADEFRVIRPAEPLNHAVLLDHDRHLAIRLDEAAARRVAGLWALAARSPRSLVHLPMRLNQPRMADGSDEDGPRLDLVLAHHSLQFAPTRWKQVRARLGPGRPQTADLPETDRAGGPPVDHAARHYRENRDLFHQRLHAETLFLTGSATLFRQTTRHFLDVARDGPGYVPVHPGRPHFCTEFHSNDGILGRAREIHVEYRGRWSP